MDNCLLGEMSIGQKSDHPLKRKNAASCERIFMVWMREIIWRVRWNISATKSSSHEIFKRRDPIKEENYSDFGFALDKAFTIEMRGKGCSTAVEITSREHNHERSWVRNQVALLSRFYTYLYKYSHNDRNRFLEGVHLYLWGESEPILGRSRLK